MGFKRIFTFVLSIILAMPAGFARAEDRSDLPAAQSIDTLLIPHPGASGEAGQALLVKQVAIEDQPLVARTVADSPNGVVLATHSPEDRAVLAALDGSKHAVVLADGPEDIPALQTSGGRALLDKFKFRNLKLTEKFPNLRKGLLIATIPGGIFGGISFFATESYLAASGVFAMFWLINSYTGGFQELWERNSCAVGKVVCNIAMKVAGWFGKELSPLAKHEFVEWGRVLSAYTINIFAASALELGTVGAKGMSFSFIFAFAWLTSTEMLDAVIRTFFGSAAGTLIFFRQMGAWFTDLGNYYEVPYLGPAVGATILSTVMVHIYGPRVRERFPETVGKVGAAGRRVRAAVTSPLRSFQDSAKKLGLTILKKVRRGNCGDLLDS